MAGRSHPRDERGAVATEFVLVAPLLIILFFGIVQVGLTVFRIQVVEAATREGARVASVGGDRSQVLAAVQSAASGFDPAELRFNPDPPDLCDSGDATPDSTTIVVRASSARLDYSIPFVGSFSPTFGATATFRCEG